MYTVKQVAELAGVSVRTLHHYDEIGLLPPSRVGSNGYRYYDEAALLRLQQILFYREIGLELLQIKDILDQPDFEVTEALRSHRKALQAKIERLQNLIDTVDQTLKHVAGEVRMSKKKIFAAFSEEQEREYTREARLQYGPDLVNESVRRWNSYSAEQKDAIREEGNQIYSALAAALRKGLPATSPEVQTVLERWHEHLRYFYEPPLEVLRGLGDLYEGNPDFSEKFEALQAGLPAYLKEGIAQYVDDLETLAIERLLAEDDDELRA